MINHDGSAFVSACPGAGKTRVVVERARKSLGTSHPGRGLALLSFTRGAISELENRLRQESLLPFPIFPNFVGTFDRFVWQFLVSPFGVPGSTEAPRLVPDKYTRLIKPFETAHAIPLSCFDREKCKIIGDLAKRQGFDPASSESRTKAYETSARRNMERFWSQGEIDFADMRRIAMDVIGDKVHSKRLAKALSHRFYELIVDEAQDCNPEDLSIVEWLRDAGVPTKVICDPHQSIYGFRGGITEQLFEFGDTFSEKDRLPMTGNFRSSQTICNGIAALRAKEYQNSADEALGSNKELELPVRILTYMGSAVPSEIGEKFSEIVEGIGLALGKCPVLAKTKASGANAIGMPNSGGRRDLTLRLATAVTRFHFTHQASDRKDAIEMVHRVILEIENRLGLATYHQYLASESIDPNSWRPQVLTIIRRLKYDESVFAGFDEWLDHARKLLQPFLPKGGRTIAQILRNNSALPETLKFESSSALSARTIHSVKGMQFPAVCVVMTTSTSKAILDYLSTGQPEEHAENCREIYVAASRAERALCVAVPKSQADRLISQLESTGTEVLVTEV